MNRGNLVAMLNFRRDAGDKAVDANAHKKAMYISPSIQNELICILAAQVQKKIVSLITGPFSIIADETRDISNQEQLCVAVRYFDKNCLRLEERYLTFLGVPSIRGE